MVHVRIPGLWLIPSQTGDGSGGLLDRTGQSRSGRCIVRLLTTPLQTVALRKADAPGITSFRQRMSWPEWVSSCCISGRSRIRATECPLSVDLLCDRSPPPRRRSCGRRGPSSRRVCTLNDGGHVLLVASGVMIIAGVKRLVHIADEMKEKLEREQTLLRRRNW